MSVWSWIVSKADHPMPQMCVVQNVQLQNNPTTLAHLTTSPKLWHMLMNHQQVSVFLTTQSHPIKTNRCCTIETANQSMESHNLMK
jgi:hypothetical protein